MGDPVWSTSIELYLRTRKLDRNYGNLPSAMQLVSITRSKVDRKDASPLRNLEAAPLRPNCAHRLTWFRWELSLWSQGRWCVRIYAHSTVIAFFNAVCFTLLHTITLITLESVYTLLYLSWLYKYRPMHVIHMGKFVSLQITMAYLCADAWLVARFDSYGFLSGLRTWRAMAFVKLASIQNQA